MEKPTSDSELQRLGAHLEQWLRENNVPLGVRCGIQGDRLIVVGHHPADAGLEPLQVLQSIQATLQLFRLTFTRRIRLYLRRVGQMLPYARCYFTLEELEQLPPAESFIPLQLTAWLEDLPPTEEALPQDGAATGSLLRPEIDSVEWFEEPLPSTAGVRSFEQYLAITSGMAIAGLALSGFIMGHPCVSGVCPEFAAAQSLSQRSFEQMQGAQTIAEVEQAQDYLESAVDLLDAIPTWSPRAAEARTLSEAYQQHTAILQRAIHAAHLAASAQEHSALPGTDLTTWAEAQMLWQEAIAQLENIPTDSPLAPFAATQMEGYRTHLAFVREQRSQEMAGQERLTQAKRNIQMAQIFHAKAETPEDWERVWASWDAAIGQLREISTETRAGIEAERLLLAYGEIPQQLGDRLQAGILVTPELPPEPQQAPVLQTPIDWADLEREIPIPPPPEVVETGQALSGF